jgi:hypothetical protein
VDEDASFRLFVVPVFDELGELLVVFAADHINAP